MSATPLEHARRLLLDPQRCPGCGTGLSSPRCPRCGLDLTGDAGLHVWQASRAAAQALAHHADVVARVRNAQRQAAARRVPDAAPDAALVPSAPTAEAGLPDAPPAPSAPWPGAVQGPGVPWTPGTAALPGAPWLPEGSGAPPVTDVRPPARPTPPAPQPTRRPPWRVQTVLVTLGAALLGLASLVFLVFTWELLTLAVRAGLVLAGTASVLALAVLLRRRGLVQSAEAVAGLGSALLALDVWALCATGMFPTVPDWLLGGTGLLVGGALMALYGRRTHVRAGSVAATALVPAAALPAAAASQHAGATVTALLLSLGLSTLRYLPSVRGRAVERRVLAAFAGASAAVASLVLVAGLAQGDVRQTVGLTLLGAVLVSTLAAQSLLATGPAVQAWAGAAGLLAALVAATAVPQPAESFVPWSAAAGAALAAALALLAGSARSAAAGRPAAAPGAMLAPRTSAAALGAAAAAGVLAVPDLLVLTARGLSAVVVPDQAPGGDEGSAAVTTAACVVLSAALGLRLVHPLRHVALGLSCLGTWAGVALLTRSVPSTTLGLAVLALAAVSVPLPSPWRRHTRTLAVVAAATAVIAGLEAGAVGAPTTWVLAQVVALTSASLVALVTRRPLRGASRAAATCVSLVLLVFACAAGARATGAGPTDAAVVAAAVVGTGVVLLVLLRVGERTERLAALAVAAGVQAVTWLTTLTAGPEVRPAAALLPLIAAVQAAGLVTLGPCRVGEGVRRPAAALVAPLLALTLATARVAIGQPSLSAALLGASALGCTTVLVARMAPGFRDVLELSGAGVATVALAAAAAAAPAGVVTLQLALAATTAGAVALAPDRRTVRWWALGLAVLASWTGLAVRDVGAPEAYTAPLGLLLVVLGARRVRHAERPASESVSRAATGLPLLAAGVLLVGLPPALVDDPAVVEGPGGALVLDRTVLVTVGVVALALGALWLAGQARVVASRTARVLAGTAALLAVAGPLRRAALVLPDPTGGPVEAWSMSAAVVLGTATLTVHRSAGARRLVVLGTWTTVLAATTPTVVVAAVQLDAQPGAGVLRLATAGMAGTAVALVGVLRGRGVTTAPGLALVGIAGAAGALAEGPMQPDAVLAVAGALSALVGATWLGRTPAAGSWPALGLPCALVLAPVLVGLQLAPDPWRWGVVLLGGTATVLVGAVRSWQAPFVVGAVVLAAEVVLQLLAAAGSVVSSVGWWPMLFLGGAVLTVVGVTYEKRLRDAREATRFVARMR